MLIRHLVDGLGLAGEMIHRLCFAAILGSPAVVLAETTPRPPALAAPTSPPEQFLRH
jgi:hypothetical protein